MFSLLGSVLLLLLVGTLYFVCLVIWRLHLSPISNFPGPKLAAATFLYELYYELWKGGQYVFKKAELHEKYGPIVRVNPWELHVNDPDFYEELYAGSGRRRDKFWYHTTMFDNAKASFATNSHELHRIRRGALNKYFSKASITRLEPLIYSIIDSLFARLSSIPVSTPIRISSAFSCLTNDVICKYAFEKNNDFVNTSREDFHTSVNEAVANLGVAARFLKQVPWMIPVMKYVPSKLIGWLYPPLLSLLELQNEVTFQIKPIMAGNLGRKLPMKNSGNHTTIFHELLSSDLPQQEKTFDRLREEGISILGAGTETTAWTLSVTTFYILSNPAIHTRLISELKPVFENAGGRPSWTQLEQIPYLHGVISEGLRLSFGVTAPLPRIAPDEVLCFGDWRIPAGTPVSMTSVLMHLNPDIFPSPKTFQPERWLENPRLSKYLVSYSKGSRQCLGMNLAYAELYLCISYMIMRFPNMKLYDTNVGDVEIVADDFVPRASGRGVRVLMG